MTFDVAVIGLGAMGSAALCHAARRGKRAIGFEQFEPGHDRGSSHGNTRIIRLGYFEHPSYVPLLRRAYALWRELEAQTSRKFLNITGIAEIGPPDGVLVPGTLASSRMHGLAHEVLPARDVMRRYPAFDLPADFVGVIQPEGGFIEAARAWRTQMELAREAGADIRTGAQVTALEPRRDGVRIVTAQGAVEAKSAIVTAGAWAKELLPDFALPLHATRQVVMFVDPPDPSTFREPQFPVFMLETRRGIHYGFPWHETDGLKVSKHHHADETVEPGTYDRVVSAADEALVRGAIAEHIPAADAPLRQAMTCLYTMTPDGDFLIDSLPGCPQIVLGSPCSGHGFKFAPVIGEILADLALTGGTDKDISRLAWRGFAAKARPCPARRGR